MIMTSLGPTDLFSTRDFFHHVGLVIHKSLLSDNELPKFFFNILENYVHMSFQKLRLISSLLSFISGNSSEEKQPLEIMLNRYYT